MSFIYLVYKKYLKGLKCANFQPLLIFSNQRNFTKTATQKGCSTLVWFGKNGYCLAWSVILEFKRNLSACKWNCVGIQKHKKENRSILIRLPLKNSLYRKSIRLSIYVALLWNYFSCYIPLQSVPFCFYIHSQLLEHNISIHSVRCACVLSVHTFQYLKVIPQDIKQFILHVTLMLTISWICKQFSCLYHVNSCIANDENVCSISWYENNDLNNKQKPLNCFVTDLHLKIDQKLGTLQIVLMVSMFENSDADHNHWSPNSMPFSLTQHLSKVEIEKFF